MISYAKQLQHPVQAVALWPRSTDDLPIASIMAIIKSRDSRNLWVSIICPTVPQGNILNKINIDNASLEKHCDWSTGFLGAMEE